ncbi:SMODS domain-containing nucleotidyltransferase [Sphingomonas parapaucimobilis]|uniref:SMODS domain-containing nucleotidyltransferase n=1 Tax=Sphingomonas parapaucimobilis TaxID=28213 RepID=UPI00321A9E0D
MELRPQFDTFLREIRPSERNKEEWKRGSNTLRARLLADPDLAPITTTTFLQGSVRRSTAVRPTGGKRSDVDVVIVTTIDHNVETPAAAMKRFEPFLNRHYAGKWVQQDRSFGIEMSYVDLDLVVTALPTEPDARAALAAIYRSRAVETDASIEEASDWVVNKSWDPQRHLETASVLTEDTASNWRDDPLMLPDRPIKQWGPTHPLAQIQWAADKNRRCNGHYVNVVRAIKWWRHEHADELPKYPKGYPLEHLIGHVLPDGTSCIAEGVVQALEGIRDKFKFHAAAGIVPTMPDHGVPTHDVLKRLTPADFTAFHAEIAKAADLARRAYDEADKDASGALWQELLGKCFPLPDPGGGDRARGFAAPAAAATPRQSDRFA